MSEESLSSWIEWKDKCALDLCNEDTAAYLTDFIFIRFRKQQQTAGGGKFSVPDLPVLEQQDAWHLFESYFRINEKTRSGKAYKDWLFDRAKNSKEPIQAIEGGATVLNRSAVKEFLRREFSLRTMDSIDRELTGSDGSRLTLYDLLPGSIDPACDVELAEYRHLGEETAATFESELSEREIICILAKYLQISLSHPIVMALTGKKHTALFDSFNKFLQRMHDFVRSGYPGEDEESLHLLTVTTYEALNRLIFDQKKAEKAYADLFALVEEEYSL